MVSFSLLVGKIFPLNYTLNENQSFIPTQTYLTCLGDAPAYLWQSKSPSCGRILCRTCLQYRNRHPYPFAAEKIIAVFCKWPHAETHQTLSQARLEQCHLRICHFFPAVVVYEPAHSSKNTVWNPCVLFSWLSGLVHASSSISSPCLSNFLLSDIGSYGKMLRTGRKKGACSRDRAMPPIGPTSGATACLIHSSVVPQGSWSVFPLVKVGKYLII